jgi:hypothetical protein
LRYAKRGILVAEVVLLAWFFAFGCPRCVAQELLGDVPVPGADFPHQPLDTLDDEFALATDWNPPESKTTGPIWMERITGLARGRTQLEGGYSFLGDSAAGSQWTQHAFPDLLLRFGLTDRFELRLGWPGYVRSHSGDPALGGWFGGTTDPNVGLAYDLWGQRGVLPQTAVLAALPVPLEGNPFALNSLQPLTELMYAWQTSDRTAVTGRSGFAVLKSGGERYTQFQQSLSFDVILTERLGALMVWDMLADQGSWNNHRQHMAGGGLSFLLTERLVLSWRSAIGLNSAAPDFLHVLRFAYRF